MMETGIAAQVRRQYPLHYTTAEAARHVRKSIDTVRRWRRQGQVVPSAHIQVGQLKVHLYTQEDLEWMQQFAAAQRPGRKRKEVTE